MAELSLRKVKKVYDNTVVAVQAFDLEIADKEFIVLVGPSGCGKSDFLLPVKLSAHGNPRSHHMMSLLS